MSYGYNKRKRGASWAVGMAANGVQRWMRRTRRRPTVRAPLRTRRGGRTRTAGRRKMRRSKHMGTKGHRKRYIRSYRRPNFAARVHKAINSQTNYHNVCAYELKWEANEQNTIECRFNPGANNLLVDGNHSMYEIFKNLFGTFPDTDEEKKFMLEWVSIRLQIKNNTETKTNLKISEVGVRRSWDGDGADSAIAQWQSTLAQYTSPNTALASLEVGNDVPHTRNDFNRNFWKKDRIIVLDPGQIKTITVFKRINKVIWSGDVVKGSYNTSAALHNKPYLPGVTTTFFLTAYGNPAEAWTTEQVGICTNPGTITVVATHATAVRKNAESTPNKVKLPNGVSNDLFNPLGVDLAAGTQCRIVQEDGDETMVDQSIIP